MSQVITHPKVDVVVCGCGMTGGTIAAELTNAGYTVVGLEKGPFDNFLVDWAPSNKWDEWAIAVERKFDQPLPISTFTIRNNSDQFALPVRRYTKVIQYHAVGHAVGGAATHYGAGMGRYGPWPFQALTATTNDGLLSVLPSNSDLQDWPITYDDAVPYYEQWEMAMGITGTNQEPFIPFNGFTYPLPPHPATPVGTYFSKIATELGYHPNPAVSAITSQAYTNQYGLSRYPCIYCGWCDGLCNYQCEVGAKSSSHVATIPYALSTGKFDLRTYSYIFRIDMNSSGTQAEAVRYYDIQGNVHVQPCSVVSNNLWTYNLTRLMLLSGASAPYDPANPVGSVGRGLMHGYAPTASSISGTLPASAVGGTGFNAYPSGNAAGGSYQILDFADDNFSHAGLNFLGGAAISFGGYLGSAPSLITTNSPGATNWGSAWKAGLKNQKIPSSWPIAASPTGPHLPTTDWYISLDPVYKDMYGDPEARITLDWSFNQWRVATYMVQNVLPNILQKMGVQNINTTIVPENSSHNDWWGHHMRGGCRMGADSSSSVFNKWLQAWDVENIFASSEGTNTFGDNVTAGTHVAGMQSYLEADGIKKYLVNPGPLV